jgi:hypothetical protein
LRQVKNKLTSRAPSHTNLDGNISPSVHTRSDDRDRSRTYSKYDGNQSPLMMVEIEYNNR